jgi:hypothetical protein
MAIDTRYVKQPLMLGVIMSINASGMKDIIGFHITVSRPLALHQLNIVIYARLKFMGGGRILCYKST